MHPIPRPDDDGFPHLLEQCRRFLLAIANAELPAALVAKGGASDLVQETMAQAYANRGQFAGRTLADLRAWLRAILLNEVTDFRRRYLAAGRAVSRETPLGPDVADATPDPGPGPDAVLARTEREAEAADLLARLPPDAQQAVVLRLEYRLGFREIGERLGRTEEAARKLFTRSIDRLRSRTSDEAP